MVDILSVKVTATSDEGVTIQWGVLNVMRIQAIEYSGLGEFISILL